VYDPGHLLNVGPFNLAYLSIYGTSKRALTHFFFITAQELKKSDVAKLSKNLRRKYGLEGLVITVRNDPWFIGNTAYPWVNPFIPLRHIPTWQEFHSTASVLCILSNENLACDVETTQRIPK
jgi:hypothetical protein